MVLIRPREKIILNSVLNEQNLKKRAKHLHKRFRSWSQQRLRQYWLPNNVNINADTQLMDGEYISACVHKAAGQRKHDYRLWKGYSSRIIELADTLTPFQLGNIFYGYGKSLFLDEELYKKLIPYVINSLPDFHSHGLMCVTWALDRIQYKNDLLFEKISEQIVNKADLIRPVDLIKICNSIAKLGSSSVVNRDLISDIMKSKLDEIFAQQFRNVMCDVSIIKLYNDELKNYILTRFSKIFICARPQHFQQAYQTAVALRVLHPEIWYELPKNVRSFYIRLSMRRIPQISRFPSKFHWDVSNSLAKLNIAHRNTFQWGCYWLDIGETEERKNCWFVDGPPSFYLNTSNLTSVKQLHHQVLSELGWNIKRVKWFEWIEFKTDLQQKMDYLMGERVRKTSNLDLYENIEKSRIYENLKIIKQIRHIK